MSPQQQDTHAKAQQYASHKVVLENGTRVSKALFLVSSAQPAACATERINFGVLCVGCSIILTSWDPPRSYSSFAQHRVSRLRVAAPLAATGMGVPLQKPSCH